MWEKEKAIEKAKDLEPLAAIEVPINDNALVA